MKLGFAALALIASTSFALADHSAMSHDHTMPHAHDMQAKIGDIALSGGFARATLPNQPVGGGYVTLTNAGGADRLVAAKSPAAGMVEIHEMAMADGVMVMRKLADGLALPAGEVVELKPGGYHLMFMQLKAPLVEGSAVPVTLTFEHAGEVTLDLPVMAPNAKTGPEDHMDHSGHMELK